VKAMRAREAEKIEAKASGLWTMIREVAAGHRDAAALLAPGQPSLDYRGLVEQTQRIARTLRAAGIRSSDRVAVVLPNGPEMAAAVVAVASSAGCAPLNPTLTQQDFEFYLEDLNAQALLVAEAAPEPALAAARTLGIQVLTMRKLSRAGEFEVPGLSVEEIAEWPGPEHVALLLHTSGTTSRPKLVPLSAANLTISAAHIARALALSPADLCLNIMPLFHVHGLMAAVLATLRAGAGVACTDGVYADRFFDWLSEFRPTWYTAVPTMHQRLLGRARDHAPIAGRASLRFVRSSSAALPSSVRAELEQLFGAPVIEAYGMTEASHQVASEPLPPARRKPGSVGPAAGPEIAIIDETGRFLAPGGHGEVVIRGPNVMQGYVSNPAADAAAFTDGWLRTGDQGWLDEEGYLFLTGRLKEVINRGGEKISPHEIDEVLLAHPAVNEAVAFAVPHAQLGEEVAAAVALKPDRSDNGADLRRWARARLASFKVPRLIRIVDSIPKGPTGKVQRIGLAGQLAIEELDDCRLSPTRVKPRTELERRIAAIWRDLLPDSRVGVEDRFEALGGDSLLAEQMLTAVSMAEGVDAPYERFIEEGTIAALAAEIESMGRATAGPIATVHPSGRRPPLCCVPAHDGALLGLVRLANCLGQDQPLWVFDHARLSGANRVETLARECVAHLRRRQPAGPYRLAGVCFGGVVAFEMARLLRDAGESVSFLAVIDTLNPAWTATQGPAAVVRARWRQWRWKLVYHAAIVHRLSAKRAVRYLAGRSAAFFKNERERAAARLGLDAPGLANRRMLRSYAPGTWDGDALVIRLPGRRLDAPALGWSHVIRGRVEVVDLPFHPNGALTAARVAALAAIFKQRLDEV
jgi:oxalate---CoA ligase